jgi:hypothetical protein
LPARSALTMGHDSVGGWGVTVEDVDGVGPLDEPVREFVGDAGPRGEGVARGLGLARVTAAMRADAQAGSSR